MTDHHRTSLLVRCSQEEAQLIRDAARRERRTLSGYFINTVLQRIASRKQVLENMPEALRRKVME